MSTTINPTEMSFFADNPRDYDPKSSPSAFDEDDYDKSDLEADAYGFEVHEEREAPSVLMDEVEDENDYSHGEGDPDAVAPSDPASVSDELEEYERGDPT